MKICYVASEVAPFSKTGGLADVSGALPRELGRLGHDVHLFTPLYSAIDRSAGSIVPHDGVGRIEVSLGHRSYVFSLATTEESSDGCRIYFVDCPELYERGEIYTSDPDESARFGLLSRAVFESCQRINWAPDVMHSHDWHSALIPLMRRTVYKWDTTIFGHTRTMLTVHNLGYQGLFPADAIDGLGLAEWRGLFDQDDLQHGRVSFLRTGLLHADLVSTVSPTYAREIQTDSFGMGLAPLLRARGNSLLGILNGVDYDEWDPEHDPYLPHHYTLANREGKALTRAHLLRQLQLTEVGQEPLVGIVSRLVPQKGFDLAFPLLPDLLRDGKLGLVVLGLGDNRYHEYFGRLQREFPGRVVFYSGHNAALAHLIEAAADIFLMPSQYEPCGLNQLFSMRYGTIPVVRRTGGLADSVSPFDPETNEGTGFLFDHFTTDGLRWALQAALDTFHDKSRWDRLVSNAMSADFSWHTQAERYADAYRRLTGR
jgi:starch synthase